MKNITYSLLLVVLILQGFGIRAEEEQTPAPGNNGIVIFGMDSRKGIVDAYALRNGLPAVVPFGAFSEEDGPPDFWKHIDQMTHFFQITTPIDFSKANPPLAFSNTDEMHNFQVKYSGTFKEVQSYECNRWSGFDSTRYNKKKPPKQEDLNHMRITTNNAMGFCVEYTPVQVWDNWTNTMVTNLLFFKIARTEQLVKSYIKDAEEKWTAFKGSAAKSIIDATNKIDQRIIVEEVLKDLTARITKEVREKLKEEIRNELKEEIKEELKKELRK